MCDYSLELYKNVPAAEGESYQLHRFPSGTMGFVKPADPECAACVPKGTQLHLEGISAETQHAYGISAVENAIMIHLDVTGHAHRDAIRFANGKDVQLQCLNAGIVCTLLPEDKNLADPEIVAEKEPIPYLIDAD